MRQSKDRPRTMALLLLAILSLMAFMAAGAQAEWRIEGKGTVSDESFAAASITEGGIQVPALELTVKCGKLATDKGVLLAFGNWDIEFHLWSSCSTFLSGKKFQGCTPAEPIAASVKGQPILHNSLTYILGEFGPSTVVEFSEETCALPSKNSLTGSFVLECLNEKQETGPKLCETEMATHFVQPASEKVFPEDKLTFGTNAASIQGVDAWKLSGANAGKKWSVIV